MGILQEAWGKLIATLRSVQPDSTVHASFKLTASAHNQAHSRLFRRGKSSLVQLREPCKQRANWKPSNIQEGWTLVSTLDQGPLLLLPLCAASFWHLVLFASPYAMAVVCSDVTNVFFLKSAEPSKFFKHFS